MTATVGLIKVLEAQLVESESAASEIGQQRERNHRYYGLQPLGNEERGRSHYVDPAVHAAVEAKKALFAETYLSSREVVRFSGANKAESDAKTAYVSRVLKKNQHERLLRDGWHDAFVAKKMTVWADWREDTDKVTLRFQGAHSQVVNQKLQQLGEIIDVDRDGLQSDEVPPQPGLMGGNVFQMRQQPRQYVHTGELVVTVDASHVELDLIQPEYVHNDPSQSYADRAMWNTARIDIARSMLVDMGFDSRSVESVNIDHRWGSASEEEKSRRAHDSGSTFNRKFTRSTGQEEVTIYKTRTWLTAEDAGEVDGFEPEEGLALYEVYWAGNEILHWAGDEEGVGAPAIKAIPEMGVFTWEEVKISHSDSGLCTADLMAHQQKAKSMLKRGVMDNMQITNNPRYEAVLDRIHNSRDLKDNVIGGVLDVDALGQIQGLPQPQLSPVVLGVIQMLNADDEERNGISSLAKGMNMGAINNQNSADMVERLTNAGQQRPAMAARDFGKTFLIPLMQCIVRIGIRNDKTTEQMESGGRVIPIAPSQWKEDELDMELEVALTPDEAADMAGKLMGLHQMQSMDEQIAPLYGVKQRHAMYDTIYDLLGIKDSTSYLETPESDQYKSFVMNAEKEKQGMMAKQAQDDAFKREMLESEQTRSWQELNNKVMDTINDNQFAEKELEVDSDFRERELDIEEEQKRPVASS